MSLLLELTQQNRDHLPVTESKWHINIKLGDMILCGTPTGLVVYPIHTVEEFPLKLVLLVSKKLMETDFQMINSQCQCQKLN